MPRHPVKGPNAASARPGWSRFFDIHNRSGAITLMRRAGHKARGGSHRIFVHLDWKPNWNSRADIGLWPSGVVPLAGGIPWVAKVARAGRGPKGQSGKASLR